MAIIANATTKNKEYVLTGGCGGGILIANADGRTENVSVVTVL